MIFLTSDLHFNHNKPFIYGPRGFRDVDEMNEQIISRMNTLVSPDDDLYILGDIMLGNNESGNALINQLNGRLHLIRGNHDTNTRIELFKNNPKFIEICDAKYLRWEGYHFFLSHYPSLTGNIEKESLKQMTLNIHGHTHSSDSFFNNLFYCYNVGVDAHACFPVSIADIVWDMIQKQKETDGTLALEKLEKVKHLFHN